MISNEDLSHAVSARIEKRNRKCGGEVRLLETAEWCQGIRMEEMRSWSNVQLEVEYVMGSSAQHCG